MEQPRILGDSKAGFRLFIRPCYVLLWNIIASYMVNYFLLGNEKNSAKRQEINLKAAGGVVITGNSGIGKTFYLAYLIKQLLSIKTNRPVIVVENLSQNTCYVIRPGSDKAEAYSTQLPSAFFTKNLSINFVYLCDVGTNSSKPPVLTKNRNVFTIITVFT